MCHNHINIKQNEAFALLRKSSMDRRGKNDGRNSLTGEEYFTKLHIKFYKQDIH
jgi:hypothetical protein